MPRSARGQCACSFLHGLARGSAGSRWDKGGHGWGPSSSGHGCLQPFTQVTAPQACLRLLQVLGEVLRQVERRSGLLVVDLIAVRAAEGVGVVGGRLLLGSLRLRRRLGGVAADTAALPGLALRRLLGSPALAAGCHPWHAR